MVPSYDHLAGLRGGATTRMPGASRRTARRKGVRGWRPGRRRKTKGKGAVMVRRADIWRVQTEPHTVPSLMEPHSHPGRSGRCHVSRPTHSPDSPSSRLLCPPRGCPPASPPFCSHHLQGPGSLLISPTCVLGHRLPLLVPDPNLQSLLESRPPAVPQALPMETRAGSLPQRVTPPTTPHPRAIVDSSTWQRRIQTSVDLPCQPQPHLPPSSTSTLFCHKPGAP